jgi:UDP-N-acetylmuramyl pentapeptide phosphotransferase/UDP-N-acetylglucosamine-1-phosphate transferase
MLEHFMSLINFSDIFASFLGGATSFLMCVFLVLTKNAHGSYTMDHPIGVQKFHIVATPRIGGLAIYFAAAVAWNFADATYQPLLGVILLAGLPAFIAGFLEDLIKTVNALSRLLATMCSAFLAWWISGYSITYLDVFGIDTLLEFKFVSVMFTIFAVAGLANAINILDGFNGLATITAIFALMGFALIATQVGDEQLVGLCLTLSACILGFFWVNWPFGKIFLGDGGSYFVGFSIAWVAVMLVERNAQVSPFAALLVCLHPVVEVIFTMCRRIIHDAPIGQPDKAHLHSLISLRLIESRLHNLNLTLRNSLTGLVAGLLSCISVLVSVFIYDSTFVCVIYCIGFVLGYVYLYFRLLTLRK